MTSTLLTRLFTSPPIIHEDSSGEKVNWSLSDRSLTALDNLIQPGFITAETGCGWSTLIFADRAQEHHCFTLLPTEQERILDVAAQLEVSMANVSFHLGDSSIRLPEANLPPLNLILIDGSHAFPYPEIDWFYLMRFSHKEVIVGVDDVWIPAVTNLTRFLEAEEGWYQIPAGDRKQTQWFALHDTPERASLYQDGWDEQGVNRPAGVRVERRRQFSALSNWQKVTRHPTLSLEHFVRHKLKHRTSGK